MCVLAVAKVSMLAECFLWPDKPGVSREGAGERSSGLLCNCNLVFLRGGTFQRARLELPLAVQTSWSSIAVILFTPSDDWERTTHSPSETSEVPSTSTRQTRPDLSPE